MNSSENYVDVDFANFKFEKSDFDSKLKIRGSMRLGMGKAYTDHEWIERKNKVMNRIKKRLK